MKEKSPGGTTWCSTELTTEILFVIHNSILLAQDDQTRWRLLAHSSPKTKTLGFWPRARQCGQSHYFGVVELVEELLASPVVLLFL